MPQLTLDKIFSVVLILIGDKNPAMFKKSAKGFTLIELLIVIAVLGILAVAVLAAINPIEQINRSRDTGKRSDAEQLLSAIDRFYASKQFYPWQSGATDATDFSTRTQVTAEAPVVTGVDECTMLMALAGGIVGNDDCTGTQELKESYTSRITATNSDGAPKESPLYLLYDSSIPGSSVYVCFNPKSGSFAKEAADRCGDAGSQPSDWTNIADQICGVDLAVEEATDVNLHCLP